MRILLRDGVEKALASSRFLWLVVDQSDTWSCESKGVFTYLWKIPKWSKDDVQSTILSDTFYTGHPGWKLQIECTSKSEHCSISVSVVQHIDDYDKLLPRSKCLLSVALVNHSHDAIDKNIRSESECLLPPRKKPTPFRGKTIEQGKVVLHLASTVYYDQFFASHDEIEEGKFVWNDKLLFKLHIKPLQ